jgi:hypothetical protein
MPPNLWRPQFHCTSFAGPFNGVISGLKVNALFADYFFATVGCDKAGLRTKLPPPQAVRLF